MKLIFVSDSFKGSLSSGDTAWLLGKAAADVFGEVDTVALPVADGGEGTVEAVVSARGGRLCPAEARDPLGRVITATYGALSAGEAVMEMASASGLPLLDEAERNPLKASTYGTGELLLNILDHGFTDISIAIGGSATNDGGMGFAQALGVRFFDAAGTELDGCGENLEKIARIDASRLDRRTTAAHITVMCDVTNPLCGPDGATYTFGKQKGATPEMLDRLEVGMQNYRYALIREFGIDPNAIACSGAAGGLGAALKIFLNAEMRSGIETVLDLIHFDEVISGADLIVTGEGRTDWQSAFGKVLQGVGDRAQRQGIPAVALCGSLGPRYEEIYAHGIASIMTTVDAPMPLQEALDRAEELYYKGAVRLFRFVKCMRG